MEAILVPRVRRERWRASARPRQWCRVPGWERLPNGNADACVTFDDAPREPETRRVLDALDACEVRATFFVVGRSAQRHHALTHEIAARGHELGLHGWHHRRHDRLDAGWLYVELVRGIAAVEAATGRRPRWYRPPHGRPGHSAALVCASLGLELVYWTETPDAPEPSSIVRLDADAAAVVRLADAARDGGVGLVTLSEGLRGR